MIYGSDESVDATLLDSERGIHPAFLVEKVEPEKHPFGDAPTREEVDGELVVEPVFFSGPVPEYLIGDDIQIKLASGRVVTGWASRRVLSGRLTFWTWAWGGERPVCVEPIGWRAGE